MTYMKDFFGNELKLNDTVAMVQPCETNLVIGKIVEFAKHKVRVQYRNPLSFYDSYSLKFPEQLIVKK